MLQNVKSSFTDSAMPAVAGAIVTAVIGLVIAVLIDSSTYAAWGIRGYCQLPQPGRDEFRAAVAADLGEGYSAEIRCPGDQPQ